MKYNKFFTNEKNLSSEKSSSDFFQYTKIQLCQHENLEISCFGCCGHKFKTKEEIIDDLKKNTLVFNHTISIEEFMQRGKDLNLSGICKHLIIKGKKIICPAHPEQNNGKEYRFEECNILHECRTSFEFNDWNEKKQEEFIDFIKKKKLDSVDFSIMVDKGELLKEFNKTIHLN